MSYCTVQDPAEVTKMGYNDKSSVTIWTHTGRKQLTPDKYMDMVEAFQPDMYHVLCDGDTNIESTQKRGQKAVDVSASMFLACAERHFKSQVGYVTLFDYIHILLQVSQWGLDIYQASPFSSVPP